MTVPNFLGKKVTKPSRSSQIQEKTSTMSVIYEPSITVAKISAVGQAQLQVRDHTVSEIRLSDTYDDVIQTDAYLCTRCGNTLARPRRRSPFFLRAA